MLHIILVNYNSSEDTVNCIESILTSNTTFPCRVCIYDNDSRAEQVRILKEFLANVQTKTNGFVQSVECHFGNENMGFAAANNWWLRQIPDGEFVWILNNDTLVNAKLFEAISQNLPDADEICYMDCHTFDGSFHDSGLHYTSLLTGKNSVRKKSFFFVSYICGASLVAKKTSKLPFWDESYFLYYEDLDYEFRLQQSGFHHKRIDGCYFQHKIGGSSQAPKAYSLTQLRAQVLFMKRYGVCYPFYFIAKLIYLLFHVQSWAVVRAFLIFNRNVTAESSFASAV